ncbi:MAG: hypothetical protein NZ805_15045 [Armatimonadetes bacterium]|nr:hypothetical protein [Armatimonadota bacterium]MDW8028880.1 hypothetical protein [Armatimonadota bacterium]
MQQMQAKIEKEVKEMGRVTTHIVLQNYDDWRAAQLGQILPEQIRTVEAEGLVDTGATLLVIPKSIADQLGVPEIRHATVRYADQRVAEKPVVGPLRVTVCNRTALFEAVVEEQLSEPLIGQIVLESLDLVVSPRELTLMPNPRSPELPMIDLL